MNRMILANLLNRPLRSLISVIAVAIEVILILLIVGLSLGMLNDGKNRQRGIGADVLVQPPGSSFLVGLSGAPVSIKTADIIRKLPHVNTVAPVIWQLTTTGALELIYGIEEDSYDRLIHGFRYLEGGGFQAPYDVIVDDVYAYGNGKHAGSTVEIMNHTFRICGIVEHGKGARKFLPLATLQDLIGAQGKASVFYVKADNEANSDLIAAEIKSVPGMGQYVIRSMRDYLSLMTANNIPGLSNFITVVIGISVTVGFLVLFQAMYTSVLERTREIGILKSMGASQLYIVNVVMRETMVLAAAGTMLGIAGSFLLRMVILSRFPTLPIQIQPNWIGHTILIAIAGALLGALYPALAAARKDPIEALAYE